MQTVLRILYPPQCLTCETLVEADFALCGPCWRDTPFIGGTVCDLCGVPLPGTDGDAAGPAPAAPSSACDDCMTIARPWQRGRSALIYRGNALRLVLGLKHADRCHFARPAAAWMAAAARPMLGDARPLVAPVPLHRLRLLRRRYNQAALLALGVARRLGLDCVPDLLQRTRRTRPHQDMTRTQRFDNMRGAIRLHPRRRVAGRDVLLVDDVMTSGATLAAAADACLAQGAGRVFVLTLARVAKEP